MMIQSDKYFSEGLKPPTSYAYLTIISPKTVFPNYAYHCLASNVRISCPTIQSSSAVFLANLDAWQTWLAGKKTEPHGMGQLVIIEGIVIPYNPIL